MQPQCGQRSATVQALNAFLSAKSGIILKLVHGLRGNILVRVAERRLVKPT
jgi:hypothetical protein